MPFSSRPVVANEGTAGLRTVMFAVWNTADGTAKTDLAAATALIHENSGSGTNSTNNFAHVSNGRYSLVLTQTEVNKAAYTHLLIGPANGSGYVVQPAEVVIVPAAVTAQLEDNGITAAKIATGAITAAKFAAGAIDAAAIADNAIDAAKIATDAITAAKIAADAVTEIQSGLATAAALTTVNNYIDTEVAAIKAKTDSLTFTVANQLDVNVQSINDTTVLGNGTSGNNWRG